MKIGIDASRANQEHKTGTEWYAYYLIRWFAKLDKKNEYILYSNEPLRGGLLDLCSEQYSQSTSDDEKIEYDKKGFQIIKSPHGNFKAKVLKWRFTFLWTQLRLSFEMLLNKIDLLFVPSHTLPIIHPKKSIVTLHDIGFEMNAYLYDNQMIVPGKKGYIINKLVQIFSLGKYKASSLDYMRWSTIFGLKKSKRIISVSNFSKKEIVDFYKIKNDKITVIYNGYNKFLYKKNEDLELEKDVLAMYGIEKPYLLYVGRIERKKNIPNLIEAFADLKMENSNVKEKLVLVGDASFGYDETKYIITSFHINNEVVMPGWIKECHLPIIYSAASAFVFPSNYEGFGIPLLQAMACGVPIAASNSSSIPEVVNDSALLFNPNDKISITKNLDRIINDEMLRAELVKKGKARVKLFSWKNTAIETLKVLNEVLSEK